MTDTHTHLYLEEFGSPEDQQAVVARAVEAGVHTLVFPNVNEATIRPMMALHAAFPKNTKVAMGLHPTELTSEWRREIAPIEKTLADGGFCAIGEVGIDLYWDKTWRDAQMEAFAWQIGWACELDLPVIIHQREALEEVLHVIGKSHTADRIPLVFHSFTGSPRDVERIREVCDPYFGINGVATFKNAASIREAVPLIGESRILLETDSPYLAPVPHRGKRNESSYIPTILHCIATTLATDAQTLEKVTDDNASKIF